MIVIAHRRLDDLRDFGVDGSVRHFVQSLLDDAARLSHLFEADEVAIIGVAVLADRNIEIHVGVGSIRTRLAYVPCDARTTQRRTRKPDGNRVFRRDDADADRPSEPDTILRKERLVLVHALREISGETSHVFGEAFVGVVRHPANAPRVTSEARAELSLEDF